MSAALNALEREQYQLNDRIDDAREEYQEAVRRQNQRARELEVASADVATKERRFADLRADLAGVQSAISTLRSASS